MNKTEVSQASNRPTTSSYLQNQLQMKTMVNSLSDEDLLAAIFNFAQTSSIPIDKSCKMISYKCFEASYCCGTKKANGYGRNEKEAEVNCARNLLEFLLEDQSSIALFRRSIGNVKAEKEDTKLSSQQKTPELESCVVKTNSQTDQSIQKSYISQPSQQPHILSATIHSVNNLNSKNQSENKSTNSSCRIENNSYQTHSSHQEQQNKYLNNDYRNYLTENLNNNKNSSNTVDSFHQNNSASSCNNSSSSSRCQQQSAPKEKPHFVQNYLNTSNDSFSISSNSCAKAPLPRKIITYEEATRQSLPTNQLAQNTPSSSITLPQQHKHSTNKSMSSFSVSLNSGQFEKDHETITPIVIDDKANHDIAESDSKQWTVIEEELKRSKNYIDHLERKIKVVLEENKILKSLLLENNAKSQSIQPITACCAACSSSTATTTSAAATTPAIIPSTTQQYLVAPQMPIIPVPAPSISAASRVPSIPDENLPPAPLNNQTKQPYFLPQGKDKSMQIVDKTSYHLLEPSQILQDFTNKTNIFAENTTKPIPNPNPNPTVTKNAVATPNQNNQKVRSVSMDVHVKNTTISTENSSKKLDTSLLDCGYAGHRRVKSKIPKLNLEVLPNYHGRCNKSINNQLLMNYQSSQLHNNYDKLK